MSVTTTIPPAGRGILFSRPMVEALLAGIKTQTRRAVKPAQAGRGNPFGQPGDRLWVKESFFAWGHWQTRYNARKGREEWAFVDLTRESGRDWRYDADGLVLASGRGAGAAPAWHARPALFMPRAASRILLEIDEVRMERLQAISALDALAEGIADGSTPDPVQAYRGVWERINGPGSWDADPLVWVVGFRRLLPG